MSHPWRWDEPEEESASSWRTRCSMCDWEDDIAHPYQSECDVVICPCCGSDNVVDVKEEDFNE